jgi:hypothetical protein
MHIESAVMRAALPEDAARDQWPDLSLVTYTGTGDTVGARKLAG